MHRQQLMEICRGCEGDGCVADQQHLVLPGEEQAVLALSIRKNTPNNWISVP